MAFNIPTLSEVNMTVENGFSRAFYGTSGTLRAMVLKVISKVVAGAVYVVCLLMAYVWKNSFSDTADVDGLVRIGAKHDLTPKPASRARGNVLFYGTSGTTIPAGTALIDGQTQKEYQTISAATIPGGSDVVVVQVYSIDFGTDCNLGGGMPLSFRDGPISGISAIQTSVEGLYGGVSIAITVDGVVRQWGETVEDFRKRIQIREQNQPAGGNDADYWEWAMRFPQVSDCWVLPNWPKTNCVTVFLADFNSDDIVLNSTEVEEVSDYINSDDRRPATSVPCVASVMTYPFECNIAVPTLNEFTKVNVRAALKKYLRTVGPSDSFSALTIRRYLIGYADVADCIVDSVKVNNVNFGSNVCTLYRGFTELSESSFNVVGAVINTTTMQINFTQMS